MGNLNPKGGGEKVHIDPEKKLALSHTRRSVVEEERAVASTSGRVIGFGIAANLDAQPRQHAAYCHRISRRQDNRGVVKQLGRNK
jgi:hypothetical protein